ncbi:hypothetical protein KIY80_gp67 [Mycobacterium phage Benvolio]|uniref:Uncharacterized protein n=1 Tax=Mycobacterium phage Benvolio TaxID=2591074 RepID=A0A514A3M8_9CAUD|nr:hypothetical protein KIY80_gp67 [Mycobacterium phage Benvolio]QDH47884.1 hypothetical protein SEA_BENVOLIO_67 [Mycobacterium phage Benvolio]
MTDTITQVAPYPTELVELVRSAKFMPGWRFEIGQGHLYDGVTGLLLMIYVDAPDSNDPAQPTRIHYPHLVPAEIHTREGWKLWFWKRILDTLAHEAGEFLWLDGERPFLPEHWPVADGYNGRFTE